MLVNINSKMNRINGNKLRVDESESLETTLRLAYHPSNSKSSCSTQRLVALALLALDVAHGAKTRESRSSPSSKFHRRIRQQPRL